MILTFAASALILGRLLGGNVRRLGDLDFRRLPWMLASFILRDGAEELFKSKPPELLSSMLLAFACYALFFYGLYPNLRFPGMWAVALGSALNFVVIVLNQARMPVSVTPLSLAEQIREIARLSTSINHQLLDPVARLPFLSDLFKWTFLQAKPAMFSVGDILITTGVSWLMLRVSLRGFPPSGNDGRIGSVT